MITEPYEWGPASVTYPDWKGTFQIDEIITRPESIYDLTGVNQDEWTIIGLDWGAGEHGPHELHVLAVPHGTLDEGDDPIEAVDFMIHDSDPFEIVQKIIHLADFRARLGWLADSGRPIMIAGLRDIPEQAD